MGAENITSIHVNESGAPTGGAERYLIALHQSLEQSGNPAILVYSRNEPETYAPAGKTFFLSEVDSEGTAAGFLNLIRKQSPKVIHFHNAGNPGVISQTAIAKPSLRTVHDSRLFCPMEFRNKKDGALCREAAGPGCLICMDEFGLDQNEAVAKLSQSLKSIEAAKQLAIILAPSNYIREQLLLNGLNEEKIVVLPHYLLNEINHEPLSNQAETTDLLFVGRVVKPKGLHLLLESMAQLPETTSLTVVGDGPDLNANKNLALAFGLEKRVNFIGWVDPKKVNQYYQQARILVVPSMFPEAFGLVGLEAMANAKPVVAFDSGGINQWLVDGANGFFATRGDTASLTEKLSHLLSDQPMRESFGKQGFQMLQEQFTQKTHMAKLLTIYQEITN